MSTPYSGDFASFYSATSNAVIADFTESDGNLPSLPVSAETRSGEPSTMRAMAFAPSRGTPILPTMMSAKSESTLCISITVSRKTRRIVAGPEVQMKGFVYAHEAEVVSREVSKALVSAFDEYMAGGGRDLNELKELVYERSLKATRRCTGGKEPMLLPLIVQID